MGMSVIESFMKCPVGYACPYPAICDSLIPCEEGGIVNPREYSCPVGYYCPAGTKDNSHFPCPVGTFGHNKYAYKVEDCTLCPPGYACDSAATNILTMNDCDAGYYCPRGTSSLTQYPCPAGTYSEASAHKIEDCLFCPSGKYCPEASTALTYGDCPDGYYCLEGTTDQNEVIFFHFLFFLFQNVVPLSCWILF
jgi:hypothetical protein